MGTFGEVRKIYNTRTQEFRCLEIFSKGQMPKKAVSRLYYEIDLMKQFDHPYIIKVHNFYETDEKIYLIQEYCSGGELHDRINATKKTLMKEF